MKLSFVIPCYRLERTLAEVDHGIGERVHKFKLGIDRLGHVIVRGKTLAAAQNKLQEALNHILMEVR